MNKKFFAALASATMAFTASGSIAVFADDFVEENTPVVNPGDIQQNPTKFAFNKDNFGALVDGKVTFTGDSGVVTLTKNEEYEASKFAEVKKITFTSDFKGEIKGLEYITGLTSFDDTGVAEFKNKESNRSTNRNQPRSGLSLPNKEREARKFFIYDEIGKTREGELGY